jgi:hypothetical protein
MLEIQLFGSMPMRSLTAARNSLLAAHVALGRLDGDVSEEN